MLQPKLVARTSALLTCLVIIAGCQRDPAPDVNAVSTGSSPVAEAPTRPIAPVTETTTLAASRPSTSQSNRAGPTTHNKGNGGDQKAAGSPIDVPTVPDRHTSMVGLRPAIEAVFTEACGDQQLCVKLEFGTGDCLLGYEPAHQAERGSTVKVITEIQKVCDAARKVAPPSSGNSSDGSPPTSSGPSGESTSPSSSTGVTDGSPSGSATG